MKHKEVEFKYRADHIPLTHFEALCKALDSTNNFNVSGYDHFFSHSEHQDRFCRLRVGPDRNELTFKRQTTNKNNYIRTEHNILLNPQVRQEQVEALVEEFGYEYNASIFKSAWIFKFAKHVCSYYTVYNANLKELGRFIEIEMAEDYPWKNEEEAMEALISVEAQLKPLDISPQARIKRSLFEMFRE